MSNSKMADFDDAASVLELVDAEFSQDARIPNVRPSKTFQAGKSVPLRPVHLGPGSRIDGE